MSGDPALAAEPVSAPPPPKRLRTDVLLTFGSKTLVLVLSTAQTIVVARALGPSDRGTLAIAYGFLLILVQLGNAGMATANPYFVARNSELLRRIVANTLWIAAGLGSVIAAIGGGVATIAPSVVSGVGEGELAVALAGVPILLAAVLLQSVLLGEGRMVAYNGVELSSAIGTVTVLVVVLFALHAGVTAALAVMIGGQLAGVLAYLALMRGRSRLLTLFDLRLALEMARYGWRLYAAQLLGFVLVRLDMLLVGAYQGDRAAGLYSVAVALGAAMVMLPTVVATNLFPRVARGSSDAETGSVFRSIALIYGLACLLVCALARPIVDIMFGAPYEEAIDLVYWLLPGIFALGMISILAQHFAGRGFPLEALLVWIPGVVLNIALDVVLLPSHGPWVASLASSIAYILVLVLHMRFFARGGPGYRSLVPRVGETIRFVRVALSR